MSDKNELFDNEMDEKTVESISDNFPILTDEEKDRIFSLIEKEFDPPNVKHEDYKDEVSGVERCIRPRWMEMLGMAAMIAIVVGSLGGGSYFMNNMKKKAPNDVMQEVTTEPVTTCPAEQLNVNDTKTTVTTVQKKTEKNIATSVVTVAVPVNDNNITSVTTASEAVTTYDISQEEKAATSVTESFSGAVVQLKCTEKTIGTEAIKRSETKIIETNVIPTTYTEAEDDITTEVTSVYHSDSVFTYDRESELTSVAEELIEKYDTISEIKSAQLPRDYNDESVIAIRHEPVLASSVPYNMHFRKIDESVFKNMDELKEFYYSVMHKNMFDARLFGPEISYSDIEHDYEFSSDTPDYFYISVDGELYGNIFGSKDLLKRSDDPVTISEINEYSFKAHKTYYKSNESFDTVTATFGIVKDLESGKWVIFSISYN